MLIHLSHGLRAQAFLQFYPASTIQPHNAMNNNVTVKIHAKVQLPQQPLEILKKDSKTLLNESRFQPKCMCSGSGIWIMAMFLMLTYSLNFNFGLVDKGVLISCFNWKKVRLLSSVLRKCTLHMR